MKKLKYLFLTLLVAFCLTGCGDKKEEKLTNEEILKQASENMKSLDNYHMNLTMDVTMSYEGASLSMSMSAKSDIDVKNNKGYMETTATFFGMTETIPSYFEINDGVTTTYTKNEDVWTKTTSEESANVDFNIFTSASSIEEVEGEENTYKINLTEEQIKELMSSTGETEEEMDLSNVTIKVTVNDKKITKVQMNVPATEGTIDATFEFSKFNEVNNVTIPQEVIDNAILEEE